VRHHNKILIIRFSSIGDIVLTTPVVRCLKEQVKNAEIHFLTKAENEPILRANPYIDQVWLYDHNFKELIPQLKSQEFHFIVDLHKNYRSSFVKQQLNVESASFPKLNLQKWITVHLKVNVMPDIHIVDRYFKAAEPLGVTNDGQGLDYFIPAGDEVALTSLPESHRAGFVAVVIGGKHNTKIFPPEKVVEICEKIARPVILLGGKEDRERGEQIAGRAGSLVFNSCGMFNLNQSASLIRQAGAVLTNDTGLMHISAAFGKRMVSVWGNTIPAFGMYPYLPEELKSNSMIAEVKGLSCRPCSKLGFSECPKKHFNCMRLIDTDPVVDFLTGR
jgi:ADP-heptose:LPS heptosyltransferase